MMFLELDSNWLSGVTGFLEGTMIKAVRSLFFSIDTLVYRLIIDLYDMFESLCSSRLLSNDILKKFSDRIGLILGLVMLFYVVFGFIQMLLEPDRITDKEKGAVSIVKKVIIVIIMFGVSDFVFNALYSFQSSVVESHFISKLLLPYSIEITDSNDQTVGSESVMSNQLFGAILSEELLHTFYYLEEIDENTTSMKDSDTATYENCKNALNSFRVQIVNHKRFDMGFTCLNESVSVQHNIEGTGATAVYSDETEMNVMYFNWFFSAACGIVVAYLMFMYCFKVGLRMVQLMFLEVISPMAFVSYLSPKKDNMFSKWSKIYVSTYIDVFIRIAIINFVFFLIMAFFSESAFAGFDFWNNINAADISGGMKSFYIVVIVLSLLTFAHKAPDLLKDLVGGSTSKLGFGASMKDIVGLQKGIGTVAGAATGAAVGLLGGGVFGAVGGVLRGGRAGFGAKGVGASFGAARKTVSEHNLASRQGQLPGFMDKFSTAVGGETTKEMYDNQIADIEEQIDAEKVRTAQIRTQSSVLSTASGYKKKMEERAENKLLNDHFQSGDIRRTMQEQLLRQQAAIKVAERSGNNEAIARAQMDYNETLDQMKQDYIRYALSHEGDPGHLTDHGMEDIYANLTNDLNNDTSGAFVGMNYNTETRQWTDDEGVVSSGYAAIKALDDAITNRNSGLSRQISVSDTTIKRQENRIQDIKNSQGYRDSHKIK